MRRNRRAARGSFSWTMRGTRTRRGNRIRRGVLVAALLAVAFFPERGLASGQQAPACHGCRALPVNAQRWTAPLPGRWAAGSGTTGTVPAAGQAYAAVGGGVAAVGDGLTLTGYALGDGRQLWQVALTGPAGSAIISVRAWRGVVTAGLARPGRGRTEVVVDSGTGAVLRRYPAALFGGAVAASATATVVVGTTSVASYDNATGKVRWWRQIGADQAWRTDGSTLYVTESAPRFPGSAPVTALRVVDLDSGTERTLRSPPGHPFAGTLASAADGVVLFTSAAGVTAYSGSTGRALWTMSGAVPEGSDPAAHLVYLTSADGALVSVDPLTGAVRASVSGSTAAGSAGIYVVRSGVALGLDSGAGGEAWGYNVAAGRVAWTVPGLPWPHYFADLSGLGGSAAQAGQIVVIAACPHLAPAGSAPPATSGGQSASPSSSTRGPSAGPSPSAAPSPSASPSPSATPSPTPSQTPAPLQLCADPELVALTL
jgi:hypothetical protein